MGLTASVIVSQWTWAATLLQSSNVAWQFGVSGPFWRGPERGLPARVGAERGRPARVGAGLASVRGEIERVLDARRGAACTQP